MKYASRAAATSLIAVTCGTPMPSTSRVVQAAPGPTPTKTAAAPCSISAKAASALVVFPTATGIGMYRVKSASDSGSYSVARWRALETWLWTRNRSAPCSAQNGPNRRAAPGVAATAAFEPAAWIASSRAAIRSSRIGWL